MVHVKSMYVLEQSKQFIRDNKTGWSNELFASLIRAY